MEYTRDFGSYRIGLQRRLIMTSLRIRTVAPVPLLRAETQSVEVEKDSD